MIKLLYLINGEELIKMKGICYIIGAGDIYTKTKIKAINDDKNFFNLIILFCMLRYKVWKNIFCRKKAFFAFACNRL